MPAVRHCSRIDTFDLKLQMERRLGSQKADKYFNLLTRYINLKLSKSEFDKLCIRLIGRENLRHHNELIKAIIKNATLSNTPPPKQVKPDIPLTLKDPNNTIDPRSNLQSLCRDVFPQSPRKGRTPVHRERKYKDRPSPLGLNGKTHMAEETGLQLICRRIPITAPFGISIHSKETRKSVCNSGSSYYTETCHYTRYLPHTNSLENRLKQKLKMEGLDISMDCVKLLNNGLDSYLKSVIKPNLELAHSRSLHKQEISMLDFRVTSEVNPKILGENWRIKLEKIGL
ncbi:unnamed protein product [Lactuca virosa]|uniref:Transcriptional coactivator Hfi1/Transcriptional adapter 1 n=1 Tax=Lactuca virosa TaxID=75947 RepID=A0AAU9NI33_9ASTR|nr:unnamed protein product [Lactuca virosa]